MGRGAAGYQQSLGKFFADLLRQHHGIFRHGEHGINADDPGPGLPMIVETAVARRSNVQSTIFVFNSRWRRQAGQSGDAEGVKKHGLGDMGVKIRIDQYDISRPGLPCFFWTCLFIRGQCVF